MVGRHCGEAALFYSCINPHTDGLREARLLDAPRMSIYAYKFSQKPECLEISDPRF